jgi:hypothetical protein
VNISSVSISQTGTNAFFLGTGANQCTTTTLLSNAQSCNVYVTFDPSLNNHTYNATLDIADNAAGSPQSASLTGVGDYFNQDVGNSTSKEPVSVFITTGGTLSTINVVMDGVQTADYTFETGGTCAIGTAYTAGQVCTVNVIFAPQYSGARNGSIYLTDASGDILGTTFLQGTGNAPQIIFGPVAPQTQIGYKTGLAGVAVDAADDIFFVNGSDQLIEAPVSGPSVTVANLNSLLSGVAASDVAIDLSGNLFIASNSSTPLIEVPRTGLSTWGAPVSINTGAGNVAQVAVDAFGNIYIAAPAQNAIYQLPFTGSGYGTPLTLPFPGSGAFKPAGVAVDPYFDVYAIGQKTSNNQTEVIYLPANNTGYGTPVTTAIAQLTYGSSVETDANGDLYVSGQTSNTNGAVYFVPASGSPVLVGTGFYFNFALDSASNIFVVQANFSDQAQIVEIPQTTPPSLTFATTNVGSTSTDSPKTVMVTNVGNEQLSIYAGSSYPTDFPENFNDTNLCNAEFPLNPGKECDVSVNFTPTASGPLSEDVTLKDEPLNSPATQQIPVSGTGTTASLNSQAINFTQPATPQTYSSGLTIPLSATGGGSENPVVFSIDGTSTGAGSISGGTLTVTSVGSFVIDANQAGNSNYSAAPQVQRTVVVSQAAQAINFTQPTSPVIYSGTSILVSLSATGGASGNAVVFTIDASSTGTGSISGSTLTVTGVGNFVIDANQTGNTNYSAAPQVQRTVVANALIAQAINFTQPATPQTYSSGLTISLSASGGGSENPVVFSIDASSTGAGSISGSTLTVTTVGSFVIDANQAGNSNYSAAPQVQRTVVVTQAPQTITFTQPTSPVTYSSGLTIPLSATGGASGVAVVFTIDASSTGAGTISGSTLTVTKAGNLVIDANQAGNTNYSAAAQVQRTVVVNVPAPDFSVASTTASQSVAPGGSAVYSITIADVGSPFTGTVTLSVTGLPTGATGAFSPPTVVPGSEGASSTLTVNIPATASVVRPSLWPTATPVLALLFMLPFRRWRKVWKGKFLLLVAGLASLACAASLTGCGGGFGFIQSQTYTLTITGTSGTDTHSTTVQLTVQQ